MRFLIKQAGLKATQGMTGAVTLVQRFGSAANLNIHLHGLFLDGAYWEVAGRAVFGPVPGPSAQQLKDVLHRIIQRLMKCLVRAGVLVEEQGQHYLSAPEADGVLERLHQAACTYRIALDPRAGQKVLTLRTDSPQAWSTPRERCVSVQGFSLHANTYCAPTDGGKLEQLCRYITRPAMGVGTECKAKRAGGAQGAG